MTIHSIVIQEWLFTKDHLGLRVAAHHFKVCICGSRNGIAILDSDKTLICLRNACHFIGSPIRQKGRSFFLKTNHFDIDEIMEQMATRIGCINDSQWRIGGFLTNCSSPKKIRSRKKKINFGSNQQPDCVVIMDADRKSSVILEADRSQIPIASSVDSMIPLGSYKRITYPIPANDPIQFVYLFRNSITNFFLNGEESLRWRRLRDKKELIDRPFLSKNNSFESIGWVVKYPAMGDLFMDWIRIVRLRAGLPPCLPATPPNRIKRRKPLKKSRFFPLTEPSSNSTDRHWKEALHSVSYL